MAGGVDLAVEEIDEGVAGLLAGEVSSKDGGDVGMVRPGQVVDTGRVGDDNCVVAVRGDGLDDVVTVPVRGKVGAVSSLLGPGLEHDNADFGNSAGNDQGADVVVGDVSVVEEVLDDTAV